jgi:hypothetical protein
VRDGVGHRELLRAEAEARQRAREAPVRAEDVGELRIRIRRGEGAGRLGDGGGQFELLATAVGFVLAAPVVAAAGLPALAAAGLPVPALATAGFPAPCSTATRTVVAYSVKAA